MENAISQQSWAPTVGIELAITKYTDVITYILWLQYSDEEVQDECCMNDNDSLDCERKYCAWEAGGQNEHSPIRAYVPWGMAMDNSVFTRALPRAGTHVS